MTLPPERLDEESEVLRLPQDASDIIIQQPDTNLITGLDAVDFNRGNVLRFPREAAIVVNSTKVYVAPVNTVLPVLSDTPKQDEIVSTSTGTWTGTSPINFTYQWTIDAVNIPGATTNSYTPSLSDVGKTLRCKVTGTNLGGSAIAITIGIVVDAADTVPVNTVAPVISGTTSIGSFLTTTNGTWTGSASFNYTYQWKSNGVNIPGATLNNYQLTGDEAGEYITCEVMASNDAGGATALSNQLGPVTDPSGGIGFMQIGSTFLVS